MVRGQRRLKTTSRAPRRSRRLKALEEKPPGCEPGFTPRRAPRRFMLWAESVIGNGREQKSVVALIPYISDPVMTHTAHNVESYGKLRARGV